MDMNGSLNGIIEELERLRWAAQTAVEERKAFLAEAQAELTRLEKILRATGVETEKPEEKPKRRGAQTRVSAETEAAVLQAIREHGERGGAEMPGVPGSFTIVGLDVPVHETSTRAAIYMLRERGVVRALGRVPQEGRLARAPEAYALVEEAIFG